MEHSSINFLNLEPTNSIYPSTQYKLTIIYNIISLLVKMLLELLSGCGQKPVVNGQYLSWGTVGLLPREVGVPELGGTILHSTSTQGSHIEAVGE